jgi:anti-anti-sigma factor
VTVIERVRGDAAVLQLRGPLTTPDAGDQLPRIVARLARDGRRLIVADLGHVSAIDAGGLGALVAAYRTCVESLGRLRLVHVPRRVQHVIDITGLAAVFEVFDSIDAAVARPAEASSGEGAWTAPDHFQLMAGPWT